MLYFCLESTYAWSVASDNYSGRHISCNCWPEKGQVTTIRRERETCCLCGSTID